MCSVGSQEKDDEQLFVFQTVTAVARAKKKKRFLVLQREQPT